MTRSMLVIGMALALVSPALAQDGPAQFQQMVHFTVKPGMEDQFEAIVKQYVEAADKTGAPNRWNVFHQGPGGSPNHYHLVTSFNEFSERDAWTGPGEMFIEAHGEEEYAAANRRWAAAVTNVHITLSTHQPDLSTKKTAGGIQNHYLATNTEIRPDKLQEYRWAIGKIREAQDKATGSPAVVGRRISEGNRWVFRSITGFDNGADRDGWTPFGEFMSIYTDEERDQIMDTLRSTIVSSRWYEVTRRPDLSHTGPAGSSN